MRHLKRVIVVVILGAIFQPLAKAAERYPFEIIVTCVANPKCIFSDGDIELNIKIKNISSKTVGLNTHYIRRVGPYIKLTDLTTGKSIDLSVNLASPDLLQEYEQLRPGTSVEFNEKLLAYQIKNFGDQSVNLLVRVAFPGNFVVAQQAPKSFDKEAIIKITDTRNYGKVYIR